MVPSDELVTMLISVDVTGGGQGLRGKGVERVVVPFLFDSPDVCGTRCGSAGGVVVGRAVLVLRHEELVVVIIGHDVVGVVRIDGSRRRCSLPGSSGGGTVVC